MRENIWDDSRIWNDSDTWQDYWQCSHPVIMRIFRLIAREFHEKQDYYVCQFIDIAIPLTSRRIFGRSWRDGVAYLAAHLIWMASQAENYADGVYPLASISEDGASESYRTSAVSMTGNLSTLKASHYGQQYLAMRSPALIII